ncbi:TPA: hypothetical protein HA265_00715 [Candidatus Woesearchaeota archaeon]|nr:hypothetical protein [Candidatus Woesearchaeota archaeon]
MVWTPRIFPGKSYKLVGARNHTQIIHIRAMIGEFYAAYGDLLALRGKRQAKEQELRVALKHLGVDMKDIEKGHRKLKKKLEKAHKKDTKVVFNHVILHEIESVFNRSISHLEHMLNTQKTTEFCDMTLYWRHAKDLERLSDRIRRSGLDETAKFHMRHQIYEIVQSIADTMEHYWVVSKSQARRLMELEELTIVSTRGEYRRMRIQSIHLDRLESLLKESTDKFQAALKANTLEKFTELKENFHELMAEYHDEIETLHSVLHESKILIRTSEKLFKAMEREAKELKWQHLTDKIEKVHHMIQKLLINIEAQMRREQIDLHGLANRMKPEEPKATEVRVGHAA